MSYICSSAASLASGCESSREKVTEPFGSLGWIFSSLSSAGPNLSVRSPFTSALSNASFFKSLKVSVIVMFPILSVVTARKASKGVYKAKPEGLAGLCSGEAYRK
jgi:hypothetical protein